jgi:two-component system phosphate regulon sensor histidine kinase PhoR
MARATGDVVGFRRIFILFCTLVLLPAMLLSGFGIVAVQNERTAAKQRQREHAEGILDVVERDLVARLSDLDAHFAGVADETLQSTVHQRRSAGDIVADAFVVDVEGRVMWSDPATLDDYVPDELHGRIKKIAGSVPVGSVAHIANHEAPFAGVLAVQRRSRDHIFVYRLDEGRLAERLLAVPDEEISVVLNRETEPDAFIVVETWMRELVESGGTATAMRDEIVRRPLPQPFDRMALVAVGPAPRTTMSVIYIVLLIVFYAILITGVVITSRLIWQETRISRLKTDFVSHVSHELRTPLTSIRMFIETLRLGRAQSAAEQAECLDLLGQETERLSEMIERVLGYARLESGRRVFHRQLVLVPDLVDDAVKAFRAHTLGDESAKSALSLELSDDLPKVDVDREAMAEALLNLMGNAYKYTGPEKRIRVVAGRQGKRVTIAVVDNGPGIPKAEWRRIFDRFYQSGHLLSREKGGSGLGLAIARRIVEGHKGRITVVSVPGQGSTFTIELPIVKTARPRA